MKIRDIHSALKEVSMLESERAVWIGSRYPLAMFIGDEEKKQILETNNIPINENSSEKEKEIYNHIKEINDKIDKILDIDL